MLMIRKAAVLGAGRMGTAVAAHLANAGIPTLLLDMAPTELTEDEQKKKLTLESKAVRNRLADDGHRHGAQGPPGGVRAPGPHGLLTPGNFDDDLAKLADVDWVVEAVVEQLDIKKDLLARVAQRGARDHRVHQLVGAFGERHGGGLPEDLKARFLGTHFFFPPRYMYLLELIPGDKTDPAIVDALKDFAELRLGKGVILSNDRPNFVANRIGIFSTVYAINAMDKYGLTIEEVDAASGRALARSVTATYGTSNLAGTDVLSFAVAATTRPPSTTRCASSGSSPQWILDMVAKGYLGEKTGGSFFREKRTMVHRPRHAASTGRWQVPQQQSLAEANKISDPVERVRKFISYDDNAAQFGWDLLAATFVYSANRVPEICDDIAQIDRGMRWGYAWDLGPFELWDALGVKETVARMQAEGRAVPEWVVALAESDDPHFYKKDGAVLTAYGPARKHLPLAARPRQISLADLKAAGKTLDESPAAGLIDLGDRVACLEFRTKAGMMTEDVHYFLEKILAAAGTDYDALVIGHQGSHFSGGADLKYMAGPHHRRRFRRHRGHPPPRAEVQHGPQILAHPGGGRSVRPRAGRRPGDLPALRPHPGRRRREHGSGRDQRGRHPVRRRHQGSRCCAAWTC